MTDIGKAVCIYYRNHVHKCNERFAGPLTRDRAPLDKGSRIAAKVLNVTNVSLDR